MFIGIIDGSHVRINKPEFVEPHLKEKFYNRKGFYSFKCMIVCVSFIIMYLLNGTLSNYCNLQDDKLKFRWFTVAHPGRRHDSGIFKTSTLRANLKRGFNPMVPRYLIGNNSKPI